jgi:hypothetical protein
MTESVCELKYFESVLGRVGVDTEARSPTLRSRPSTTLWEGKVPSADEIRRKIHFIQLQLVEISARLDASPLNSFARAVLEMSSIELKQELDYGKGYLAEQTGNTIQAIEQELGFKLTSPN